LNPLLHLPRVDRARIAQQELLVQLQCLWKALLLLGNLPQQQERAVTVEHIVVVCQVAVHNLLRLLEFAVCDGAFGGSDECKLRKRMVSSSLSNGEEFT
jgi:hypothetical protein